MAEFTIYLKDAVVAEPGILSNALTEYPIFNEDYRDHLNQTILDNFWNQEIGVETASLFEFNLRRKMNLIMPLYNEHYKTSLLAAGVDPLQTTSVESEGSNTADSETGSDSESTSRSGGKSRAVASDFPQTQLSGEGDYASSAQDNNSESTANGTGKEKATAKQKGNHRNTVKASHGQASVLLFQHRQTLVNVDEMVLNDLKDLFMGLWSNGDSATQSRGFGYGYGYFGY